MTEFHAFSAVPHSVQRSGYGVLSACPHFPQRGALGVLAGNVMSTENAFIAVLAVRPAGAAVPLFFVSGPGGGWQAVGRLAQCAPQTCLRSHSIE